MGCSISITTMSEESSNHDAGHLSLIEQMVPESLLAQIVEYLTFSEAHKSVFALNRRFWFQHRLTIAQATPHASVDVLNMKGSKEDDLKSKLNCVLPLTIALSCYSNLRVLDLPSLATDELLGSLTISGGLPRLSVIRMRRSLGVTDRGLEYLTRNTTDRTLEEIDITFCQNTTYQGTFVLRDKLPQLKLLRRQPEWLDGQFHTPIAPTDDGSQVEIHTFWPDGTFSFNRATQSKGFVLDWNEQRKGDQQPTIVTLRHQYNNFVPPPGWNPASVDDIFRFAYRPGMCLLQLPSAPGCDERLVLLATPLRRLKAPTCMERVSRVAGQIPEGSSRYVDPCTLKVHMELDMERWEHWLLVSKMKVYPLQDLMPPAELVEECRQTCLAMAPYEEALTQVEDMWHVLRPE
ncbi:expressed unknown protein [Seminavis robusta]|uniref:F-box domain-containing protein n=1 Tax=Seminavis robusta TaxID=568900 RepID=A0A9N8HTF4_9STRA|nr:expressed unknown protein [Seminavis robusta]|eukprot:Sro1507_g278320.1 n/a (405) ;mRNA; f:3834-5048